MIGREIHVERATALLWLSVAAAILAVSGSVVSLTVVLLGVLAWLLATMRGDPRGSAPGLVRSGILGLGIVLACAVPLGGARSRAFR